VFTYFLSFVFYCITGLIVPLVMIEGELNVKTLLFFSIVNYGTFRLSKLMHKKEPFLLEVSFFIFVYVFLGLTPLVQSNLNKFPLNGFYANDEILWAGIVIWLGIISYEIGLFIGKRVETNNPVKSVKANNNFGFLVVIALVCFIVATYKFGGLSNLFLARTELNNMFSGSKMDMAIYNNLLRVPILVALLYSLIKFKNRVNRNLMLRSNFKLLLIIFLLFIINIVASNPFSSARYWLGTVVFSIMFVLIKLNKRTIPLVVAMFVLIMLFVFPYSDIFRHSKDSIEIDTVDINTTLTQDGDFDAFQQLLNTKKYTEVEGFAYGEQLVGTFLFWVPRSIWDNKPIGTGEMVAQSMGYKFTNLSAPLWAEFYVNFGIIGVLSLFTLYGWLSAKLQRNYIDSRNLPIVNFSNVFVPIYSAYQIFLLRGELLGTFVTLATSIFFIVIGTKFISMNSVKQQLTTNTHLEENCSQNY
jgi:oligosaccharide repeat unit polymerase